MIAFQGVQKAQAVNLADKSCSVTVQLSKPNGDGPQATTTPTNMSYSLYKVAAAVADSGYDAYIFQATEPFSVLESDIAKLSGASADASASHEALAQKAAGIVYEAAEQIEGAIQPTATFDGTHALQVDPGLYLLVAYGTDALIQSGANASGLANVGSFDEPQYVSTAYSATQEFTFSPQLVSLPIKEGGNNTAASGNWIYSVPVTLKWADSPRMGRITITKSLPTFEESSNATQSAATFVFDIKGYATRADYVANANPVYTNVASITFSAAGSNQAIINNVPAGLYVVVTEVYTGTSYELVSGTLQEGYVEVPDGSTDNVPSASFSFENAYNAPGTPNKGGSVTNSFAYDGQDWEWSKDGAPQNPEGGEN